MDGNKYEEHLYQLRRRADWVRQIIAERATRGEATFANQRELDALEAAIKDLAFLWKVDLAPPVRDQSDDAGKAVIS